MSMTSFGLIVDNIAQRFLLKQLSMYKLFAFKYLLKDFLNAYQKNNVLIAYIWPTLIFSLSRELLKLLLV